MPKFKKITPPKEGTRITFKGAKKVSCSQFGKEIVKNM